MYLYHVAQVHAKRLPGGGAESGDQPHRAGRTNSNSSNYSDSNNNNNRNNSNNSNNSDNNSNIYNNNNNNNLTEPEVNLTERVDKVD